ncbi:MAG: SDR family oxidoreductase, partial [Chloroflexi bacterium]|nr:SDR family oxidoreductase [Chloroflexota bacterium]
TEASTEQPQPHACKQRPWELQLGATVRYLKTDNTIGTTGVNMLLEGKKALVTGARKGIGRGVAVRLAAEGADVGIADILLDDETERTAELVRGHGRNASLHQVDATNLSGLSRMFDEFVAAHGRIDVLVNNAIMQPQNRPFFEVDEAFWDHMMDLSLKGYFFAAQRAAREMVEQGDGGAIVSMASVHAYRAFQGWTPYGIAKAGLRRMAMGMATDLSGTGVRVNCIAPGYIDASFTEDGMDPERQTFADRPAIESRIPMRVGGVPSDIAGAVVFLCSDMGGYVNGETLLVDGGMIASGGSM